MLLENCYANISPARFYTMLLSTLKRRKRITILYRVAMLSGELVEVNTEPVEGVGGVGLVVGGISIADWVGVESGIDSCAVEGSLCILLSCSGVLLL